VSATKSRVIVRTTKTVSGACYCCDGRAVGIRDRRPEGGDIERACARHEDPTLFPVFVCMYCDEPVRAGSVVVDGDYAHAKCHREECAR
jgi:hypothetical protein